MNQTILVQASDAFGVNAGPSQHTTCSLELPLIRTELRGPTKLHLRFAGKAWYIWHVLGTDQHRNLKCLGKCLPSVGIVIVRLWKAYVAIST